MRPQDRQDRVSIECWDCGTESRLGDNYCSECGSPMRARLLPAVSLQRSLPARRSSRLAPVVARGVTLLVAGKVAEWALRRMVGRVASIAILPATQNASRLQSVSGPAESVQPLPPGSYSVSTLVVQEMHVLHAPAPAARKRRFLGFGRE